MRLSVAATNGAIAPLPIFSYQPLRRTAANYERSLQALFEHGLPRGAGGARTVLRRRADRGSDDLRTQPLLHPAAGSDRPAGAVRSPPPRRRRGDRLPVLPLPGGKISPRRRATHQRLPQLPRADLEQEPETGAGA